MLRTKSIEKIEQRMQDMDENSLRYQILEKVKNFKISWISLGQALYSVWKDKLYKEWGYLTFEAYTAKEIGIKKQTAMKLLRSYYFLEKEEPEYLEKDYAKSEEVASIPSCDAVNVLRLARNKKTLDAGDYTQLKKKVFEKGQDAREIKKDLTALIRDREELEPEEARRKKKITTLKRLLGTLRTVKRDMELLKMIPAALIKETGSLIKKIESEIG
ncbi:MAG: hypothetical protein KKD29_07975 [Candidatus Omnitrophica bacterium]|nr:hypothetical protein [Candidatus Omnitrophota bacterium]MBU4488192.1 hypothetical protein [Candidatus Omnitrophota bacterium]MCG2705404.1 hypothetical protein [Candidatus Omnitrophota bacterium]